MFPRWKAACYSCKRFRGHWKLSQELAVFLLCCEYCLRPGEGPHHCSLEKAQWCGRDNSKNSLVEPQALSPSSFVTLSKFLNVSSLIRPVGVMMPNYVWECWLGPSCQLKELRSRLGLVWKSRMCSTFSHHKEEMYRTVLNKNPEKRDFPGVPVAKTLYSQCRGCGFSPWSGN